jgi:hypothetical protein
VPDAGQLGQLDELGHRYRFPAQVRGDDQRVPRGGESSGDLGGDVTAERGGRHRAEHGGVGGIGLDPLFHRLPRTGQVYRAGRLAARDLQGPVDQLLDVAPGADLVVVLHVVAQDPALIADILDPVDELVPPARQFTLHRVRSRPGENQDRHPAAHRVVDGAAEILGAGVDVHDHGLRLAGHHRVGVRGGQRDGLVRAHDQPGQAATLGAGPVLSERLENPRMVAAEVGEDVADARLGQRLKERGARRVHAREHKSGSLTRSCTCAPSSRW